MAKLQLGHVLQVTMSGSDQHPICKNKIWISTGHQRRPTSCFFTRSLVVTHREYDNISRIDELGLQ